MWWTRTSRLSIKNLSLGGSGFLVSCFLFLVWGSGFRGLRWTTGCAPQKQRQSSACRNFTKLLKRGGGIGTRAPAWHFDAEFRTTGPPLSRSLSCHTHTHKHTHAHTHTHTPCLSLARTRAPAWRLDAESRLARGRDRVSGAVHPPVFDTPE